ncbi:MAG: hypothetical protein Q8K58_08480 [Acidimicrobiales bacterium]|nr:hypothetical protein [Acidimicrobiales bacterium]
MKRVAAVIAALTVVGGIVWAGSAQAALSQVRVGNFYYEDATVGDGKIEIRQGDQVRFIVEGNGPGTPHSVEVEALGIHSGGLSTGDTYTTPPIQQTGSFKLYCDLHENRGHVTTLVVLAGATATTAAPTTTAAPAPATTASGSSTPTTAPPSAVPGDSSVAAGTGDTGSTAPPGAPGSATDNTAADSATGTDPADTTDTTLASGLGQASDEDLDALPVDPDSLEAVLGRPPATRGPWTRSVRMALLGMIPLLGAAAIALARFARAPDLAPSVDPASPHNPILDARAHSSGAGRTRPLRVDPDAIDTA